LVVVVVLYAALSMLRSPYVESQTPVKGA
jgi:hypothetical protein